MFDTKILSTAIVAISVHIMYCLRAGIANLENSEGGISVEGGILIFRLRGVFLENSKRREKSEVRL